MKKIGFIDYFIDEWHANNYPAMIGDSALRFGEPLEKMAADLADKSVNFVRTSGSDHFNYYAIHQLEMLVMVLGTGATRVMQCGTGDCGIS